MCLYLDRCALPNQENRDLAIGEIIYMHTREGLIDPKTIQLNLSKYGIIGRLFGDLYTPIVETFAHARLNHSEWFEKSST